MNSSTALVQQLISGVTATNLVYVAAELRLPDLLKDGPLSSAELAQRTGSHPDALRRIVLGLCAIGVLELESDNRVCLTAAGACLRSDAPDSLRPLALLVGDPACQRAWSALKDTARTGESGFDLANGFDFGTYLEQRPDLAVHFNAMMAGVTASVAPAVVAAYDFDGVETIVDVGGGEGVLLRAILRAHPAMRGCIVDLPHVRARAEEAIARDGLTDRCEFVTGDFFDSVPAGADMYLLKSVIHDWDDQRSAAIVATVRHAMSDSSKLLLVEALMPETGLPPMDVIMSDLIMLSMVSGRERARSEHEGLLSSAGLRLARLIPTTTKSSLLEAVPAEVPLAACERAPLTASSTIFPAS